MSDNDSPLEEDEVESLVYVEFEGIPGSELYDKGNTKIEMIGIDTDHPIMRVDDRYYEGTYEDAVGTYMFFDKENNPVVEDPVFDTAPKLRYVTKTRKLLKMRRIFVKPRLEVLGDSNHPGCIPNMETIKKAGVPPIHQKEALDFWKKMREERLDALNKYLEKQRIRDEKKQQGIIPDSDSDEENPFAMYKAKNAEDLKKSSVEEPTPSTSQDNSPTDTGKTNRSSGYIIIPPTKSSRSKPRKRSVAKSPSAAAVVDEMDQAPEESEGQSEIPGEEIPETEDSASTSGPGPTDEDDAVVVVSSEVVDKKREKEMRRIAKLNELSERLQQTIDAAKSRKNE